MATKSGERVFHLETMSHTAVRRLDRDRTLVIATLSPLEVHGPHLPLGQDYFEAYALAERICAGLADVYPDWTFLLLPPIPVATDCVPELGSVNFPARVTRDVAYYALEPFAKAGFARLVYSSFHGGPRHNCALEAAAADLTEKYDVPAASLFSMVLTRILEGDVFFEPVQDAPGRRIERDQLPLDRHAGYVETSIGLHLWPDLVEDGWQDLPPRTSESEDGGGSYLYDRGGAPTLADRIKKNVATGKSIYRALKHFSVHTYFGYPAFSSADEGERLLAHLAGIGVETTREFIEKGSAMNTHSPLWKLHKLLLNPVVNKAADDWLKIYNK